MTVIINKRNKKETHRILSEKMKKKKQNGKLSKHFGKMKRKIDGLAYQITVRSNED